MTDLRDHIKTLVSNIQPYDALELAHIEDVKSWIESGADLFRVKKPDVPLKHLVSYFVVVDQEQRSLLLVDHIKAQLWLPSGGHVEAGENPRNTVVREFREELGGRAVFLRGNDTPFFVTITETVGLTAGHVDVSLWYLLYGSVRDFYPYDKGEFNDIEWFTFDEVLESDPIIFDPHMYRFVNKLIANL